MNKNISIYSLIYMAFAILNFATSAIAAPIPSQLASNNFILRDSNEVALKNSNNESRDNLTKIIFFMGLIGTGALFWTIFKPRQGITQSSFKQIENKPKKALLDRVSPKLRRQLLRLVNDPKTANRLLMGIYKNNRDRSPNWIAEKAIYDLRRGR